MDVNEFLENLYNDAMSKVGSGDVIVSDLDNEIKKNLNEILERSESAKAVLTVILTSAVYKSLFPDQDIRNHQTSIEGGYSGRNFDKKYITPFMKSKEFPAMAESGWLTRSLEQKVPYDFNYTGAITPLALKAAFLSVIDFIENSRLSDKVISYLIQGLVIKRNSQIIQLAKPSYLPINTIVYLLGKHFHRTYSSEGASRLPVLALYAAYECLIDEVNRFNGKKLMPIESHTSADRRSGRIGDIDVCDVDENVFEAVEVKFGVPIDRSIINTAYEKFKSTQVKRYYLLSTADLPKENIEEVFQEIARIKNIHGCSVIVNGVIDSVKYYLRLLTETSRFIGKYVDLLEMDTALKFEHKSAWNSIISELQ